MRAIKEIILHCTATPEGHDYTTADIDYWHRQRGFAKIGYHFVIYRDGSVQSGRDVTEIGAHCKGHNTNSIGICYVGGLSADGKKSVDTRTAAQKEAIVTLVKKLQAQYPGAKVYGHNEFAAKDCPCFDVKKEFRQ
jgi:N-acetylmuramoyl-L-alanine amidase